MFYIKKTFSQQSKLINYGIFLHIWFIQLLSISIIIFITIFLNVPPSQANQDHVTIHTYSSLGEGGDENHLGMGAVNSYWIETEKGIIVIDSQRSLNEAKQLLKEIQKTGKPILGILLTHHHPDHLGGLPILIEPDSQIPIYGSQKIVEEINQDTYNLIKITRKIFKDDFPQEGELVVPNHFIKDGDMIQLGEQEIQVREFGPNETSSMTIFHLPIARALFCADLINNGMTPYLIEGHISQWIETLETLPQQFPTVETIYPGHGNPGEKNKLITKQLKYLKTFRNVIASRLSNDKQLSESEKKEIIELMELFYPNYQPVAEIPHLLMYNIDAIGKELKEKL